MAWPWVTRRSYDELMHVTERLQEDLRIAHQCLSEAQRHSSQLIAALTPRSPSESVQEAPKRLTPMPVAEKDEVAEAIELAARDNALLARHLGREALRQKLEGANERDIINSILHWQTIEPEDYR